MDPFISSEQFSSPSSFPQREATWAFIILTNGHLPSWGQVNSGQSILSEHWRTIIVPVKTFLWRSVQMIMPNLKYNTPILQNLDGKAVPPHPRERDNS